MYITPPLPSTKLLLKFTIEFPSNVILVIRTPLAYNYYPTIVSSTIMKKVYSGVPLKINVIVELHSMYITPPLPRARLLIKFTVEFSPNV